MMRKIRQLSSREKSDARARFMGGILGLSSRWASFSIDSWVFCRFNAYHMQSFDLLSSQLSLALRGLGNLCA
jgi:hypothetical protein